MTCFLLFFLKCFFNQPLTSQSPFLIFLVTTLLLPTSLPVIALYSIRPCGHSHLIPFTISVSLAIAAYRQSPFQHPKLWKINPSSTVSAQDFRIHLRQNPPSCGRGHTPSEYFPSLAACNVPYYEYSKLT